MSVCRGAMLDELFDGAYLALMVIIIDKVFLCSSGFMSVSASALEKHRVNDGKDTLY